MTKNNCFQLNRLYLLLRREIVTNYKMIVIATITFFSILLVFMLFNNIYAFYSLHVYFTLLFLGGIWLGSLSFSDLHNPPKAISYLMLPASPLEKTLCRFLLTSFGLMVVTLFAYTFFVFAITAWTTLVAGTPFIIFNPLQHLFCQALIVYFIIQSIVALCSTYFGKHVIIKTLLAVSLLLLALFVFTAVLFKGLVFPENISPIITLSLKTFFHNFYRTIQVVEYIIPAYCWIIIYFRLKESEV